jgi:hypothetical protein
MAQGAGGRALRHFAADSATGIGQRHAIDPAAGLGA